MNMFSYFKGGIQDTFFNRHIDLPTLVKLIKDNPEKFKIEKVRELRRNGKDYDSLKKSLPNVTPNCLLKVRKLKDADYNLFAPSSYIYFDIDDYPNSLQLKEKFIRKYGHLASIITLSCSLGGVSIFFKVSNNLKSEKDFEIARNYILDTILYDEEPDSNAGGIARAYFIPYDPDIFYNYENEIEVPDHFFKSKGKKLLDCLLKVEKSSNIRVRSQPAPKDPFQPLPISTVLMNLIFETQVHVENPIVDFKEVEYVEVRFQYLIKDGLKHKTFTNIVHKLMYLNTYADRQLLLSFLYHVNEDYTGDDKMDKRELIRLFDMVFDGVKNQNNSKVKPKLKKLHYNKDCGKHVNKRKVSAIIRGALKENDTKNKILLAIEEMKTKGLPITKSGISKYSGINRGTIIKHLDSELNDIEKLIQEINDSF